MTFTVEKFGNLPIVISTPRAGFTLPDDQHAIHDALHKQLDEADTSLFYIVDFTKETIPTEEMLEALNAEANRKDSLWNHPNIREIIFITDDEAVKSAIQGARDEPFGHVIHEAFTDREMAMAYIHTQL